MTWQETFNRSRFSHFINSPPGRIFRVVAGAAFSSWALSFGIARLACYRCSGASSH